MIKYFEDKLFEKTKDTSSDILFAQWNYDKKVIPLALQAVSHLFPHYSLHDESHSITILNNIVRVLGKENIEKLSAIDIWLLLEAAYSHDLGMVVSSDKLVEAINSARFIDFFKEISNDDKNGLHEFTKAFQIADNKIIYKDNFFSLNISDGIKFLLAEFFRRVHAERSKEIILNPTKELSLLSPRGVIPNRIFGILANICECHTKDFSDVMKLPFSEVGIDTEDAHPRFIACLLRIGDLLDLDNNRFSEVILRTLTKIPLDTINHKAKHLAIQSFRVDREVIEIFAKCSDYDTASITQHWFNYINSEVSAQLINWNNIVPDKNLGYLPTIGTLRVELEGYDYIDGKTKPKFTVDTDKALSLLQGAGLYDGPHQAMREVLQNAIDATLIRIWLEHKEDKDFSSPQSQDFIYITENYPIDVLITEIDKNQDWKTWEIKITDKGTGISSIDLKYLTNTGSSSKNEKKTRIIDEMPPWLKPSGIFGIGFQSIFMLTDLVLIETKSFMDEEYQIIEFNSPTSKKDGNILIQKKKTSHSVKPGTTLTFQYKTKTLPNTYELSGGKNVEKITSDFDPFKHESLDYDIALLIDTISDFTTASTIPINLILNNKPVEPAKSKSHLFNFYDHDSMLEMNISKTSSLFVANGLYYKSQKIQSRISPGFLAFDVNVHTYPASDILTINRNKIKDEYWDTFNRSFYKTAYKLLTEKFDDLFTTDEAKISASQFLHFYNDQNIDGVDISRLNHWENFSVFINKKKEILYPLLQKMEILKVETSSNFELGNRIPVYRLKNNILEVVTGIYSYGDEIKFVKFLINSMYKSIISVVINQDTTEVLYSKEEKLVQIPNFNATYILKEYLKSTDFIWNGSRTFITCFDEYRNLRIKNNVSLPYVHFYNPYNIIIQVPMMLSPFTRDVIDGYTCLRKFINDKLLQWVYENRYYPEVTLQDITETYDTFCDSINIDSLNSFTA